MQRRMAHVFISLLAVTAMLATACQPTATPAASSSPTAGSSAAPTQAPGATPGEPSLELAGEILIDGSSTVFPISEKMSDEFTNLYTAVEIPVGESGTGGGFKKFCNDELDIANASRPIKAEEKAACEAAGVAYAEFKIGTDGLAVVVNPNVDFVDCLTFAQLKTIWAPEAEGVVTSWDAVDASFPATQLTLFGPGTDSGTYDYFNETVLGKNDAGEIITPRTDYQPSEDDNVLVQGVSGEDGALGYFGLAYYENNKAALKVLGVDMAGDGNCVQPSAEAVLAGSYPLARPLFIYVKQTALARPEVHEFVKFFLANAEAYVAEVGYVALPAADYEKAMADFETLMP